MTVQTRHVLLDELVGRLHALDDQTLAQLNATLAAGQPLPLETNEAIHQSATTEGPIGGTTPEASPAPESRPRGTTRRAFLTCATVLGGTGAAVTATGGYALWRVTQSQPAQNTLHSEHLQNLLRMYKALDDVGLDEIAANGVVRFSGLLQNVGSGALLLKDGIEQLEEMLAGFERFAAQVREDLYWIDGVVAAVSMQLQQLQSDVDVLAEWLNPTFEAVGTWADQSLGLLPESVEMPVRTAWRRIRETAASVPTAVAQFQQRLLPTLKAQGFATANAEDERSVENQMIEPVSQRLLTPLKQHLEEFAALAEAWQNLLAEPMQQAVDKRLALRQQIAQYREENDLA